MTNGHPSKEGRRGRCLRILVAAPYVPWPATTYSHQVVASKAEALAAKHDVVFVTGVHSPGDAAALAAFAEATGVVAHGVTAPNTTGRLARVAAKGGNVSRGLVTGLPHKLFQARHAPLRRALETLSRGDEFDLIQVDYWYMGLGWVESASPPSLCYVHDLLYERLERRAPYRGTTREPYFSTWGLRRRELATLRVFDALATISPRDAGHLARELPEIRIESLPAGVDCSGLDPLWGAEPEAHSALFLGALGAGPNEDAAWACAEYVWPLVRRRFPDAQLYIVGRGPSRRIRALAGRPGIAVVADVPDVRPWYQRCATVVAPLRWGSGMKGKVLEAMALGRPVVATAIAMEGIEAQDGEHYLAADDPLQFVAALTRLFSGDADGPALARAARALVEQRYERAACMGRFVAYAEAVAAGARTGGASDA